MFSVWFWLDSGVPRNVAVLVPGGGDSARWASPEQRSAPRVPPQLSPLGSAANLQKSDSAWLRLSRLAKGRTVVLMFNSHLQRLFVLAHVRKQSWIFLGIKVVLGN